MELRMRAELNYMRDLRHPCLGSDLQTRVFAWTLTFNGVTIDDAAPTLVRARDT